jgi:hypothetical protein
MATGRKRKPPRARDRRPIVTVNLGMEVIRMLDDCVSLLRTVSVHKRGPRAITRSHAIRQAIERLWDALTFDRDKGQFKEQLPR